MSVEPTVREALLAFVPNLRAFAISLCHDQDQADDIVQETLVRAWAAMDRFERGTNLHAWLFTILRNVFLTHLRKRKHTVEDPGGSYAAGLTIEPGQGARVGFEDLRKALAHLPPDQREAVLLVGAEGFSYAEAGAICGCPAGTIKSRVNRAREKLAMLLAIDGVEDFGPDRLTRAALEQRA